jgi:hypothetical protein
VGRSIAVRRGGDVLRVGRREEGGGSDGWGPLGSDVRGNAVDGLCKLEEDAPFGKYGKAAQVEWAECAHGGLRAKQLGLLGAGPDGGRNRRKNDFRIKFEFSKIQRLWKFAQGDLGGILT